MPKKLTQDEFLEKARKIHGDKYDYSKVEYKTTWTPVAIICPEHGTFYQVPHNHLLGHGCPMCGFMKRVTKNKEYYNGEK